MPLEWKGFDLTLTIISTPYELYMNVSGQKKKGIQSLNQRVKGHSWVLQGLCFLRAEAPNTNCLLHREHVICPAIWTAIGWSTLYKQLLLLRCSKNLLNNGNEHLGLRACGACDLRTLVKVQTNLSFTLLFSSVTYKEVQIIIWQVIRWTIHFFL